MAKTNKKPLFFGEPREFKGKSIDLSGCVLTKEIIMDAARTAREAYGKYHDAVRYSSPDGLKMLKKIRKIEPKWNLWMVEWEIWAKAKSLNLL